MFINTQYLGLKPLSQELQYHLAEEIPLDETIFRLGSDAWGRLLREARELYKAGAIDELDENEYYLLESDAGEVAEYAGKSVLLDVPDEFEKCVYVRDEAGNICRIDISTVTGLVTPES